MKKTMKRITGIAKMFDTMEALGWSFSVPLDFVVGSATEFDINNFSPAGEDLYFELSFDGTPEGLATETDELYENFDVDDHVKMWIEAKDHGVAGVPNSIRELVEDAEAIEKMLASLNQAMSDCLNGETEAEK